MSRERNCRPWVRDLSYRPRGLSGPLDHQHKPLISLPEHRSIWYQRAADQRLGLGPLFNMILGMHDRIESFTIFFRYGIIKLH